MLKNLALLKANIFYIIRGDDAAFKRGTSVQNGHTKPGSRIPVRSGSNSSNQGDDLENLRQQLSDLVAKNSDLQHTLKATEETVHCQTQKMKLYRSMLVENGLMPRSRSNSLPNSSDPTEPQSHRQSRRKSSDGGTDKLHPRFRSASPLPRIGQGHLVSSSSADSIGPEGVDRLNRENSKLRQQVDGYRRVLQVFQSRSPSPPTPDSERTEVDGEPGMRRLCFYYQVYAIHAYSLKTIPQVCRDLTKKFVSSNHLA